MVHQDCEILTCRSSCMTFSTAVPLKLPLAERVSFTATLRAERSPYAMLTIMAVFLWMSRWRLPADRNDVICSRILSWILGVCKGRQIANNCRAELTTSVAGGSGRSELVCDGLLYKEIESCSIAPHMGDRSWSL